MREIADQVLPNLIGSQKKSSDFTLMVGYDADEGEFQLVSLGQTTEGISTNEVVVSAAGWDNFVRSIASEMIELFVPTVDMMNLEGLEESSYMEESQKELVVRAKAAANELNEINRILFRCGVVADVTTIESSMMSGSGGLTHISVKYMKEMK